MIVDISDSWVPTPENINALIALNVDLTLAEADI
jgi:hypothetical protein